MAILPEEIYTSSNPRIAIVDAVTGAVTGLAAGRTTVMYSIGSNNSSYPNNCNTATRRSADHSSTRHPAYRPASQ